MVGQQTRFGDKVDIDLVRRVGTADVPHQVGFRAYSFHSSPAKATVHRFERRAIGADQCIVAAIAVHEVERGAAVRACRRDCYRTCGSARLFPGLRASRTGPIGNAIIWIKNPVVVQVTVVVEQIADVVDEDAKALVRVAWLDHRWNISAGSGSKLQAYRSLVP